jgi:lipid II:glycine glycyltransferase (peptidoglycan interpeptide bridge formation enzyme)
MNLEIISGHALTTAAQQEICAFLDSQDTSHPFQYPQWAGTEGDSYPSERWFGLGREGSTLAAFASCAVQRPAGSRIPVTALIINRGPVCDDGARWQEALQALVRGSEDRKLIYIDAAPERIVADEGSSGERALFPASWSAIGGERLSLRLDVTRSEEEIFQSFRKVARYEVRRAERAGVTVGKAVSAEESEGFIELYLRLAKRKGFMPDGPQFMHGILGWLQGEPKRGGLWLAKLQDAAVAGAVIVRAGRRCWYVWGASEEQRNFSAGHLLQWHAIRWAKSQGCTQYDFGGYTPGATSGPAWFKEGFGGKVVRLLPPHRIVLRPQQYRWLEAARNAKEKLRRARRLIGADFNRIRSG